MSIRKFNVIKFIKMQTIEVSQGIQVGFEEIIKGIQKLDNQSLAHFAGEINRLVSSRKGQNINSHEAELIKKLKTTIPPSIKRRQKQLFLKLQDATINSIERDELLLLNDLIEQKTAERIVLMGELAKIQKKSILQLSKEFDK